MIKHIMALVIAFSSLSLEARPKRKPSSIDIRSSEEILFYDKKDIEFSDMGKIDEYLGELVFVNESLASLSRADLYRFPRESKLVMTSSLCANYIDRIFGPDSKRTLKIQGAPSLFDTSVGKACVYELKDSYHHANRPYRIGVVGFIHGKLTALTWSFGDKYTDYEKSKLTQFWKTLK